MPCTCDACHKCKAEIASLRAELTATQNACQAAGVRDGNLITSLRAELVANNELYSISQSDLAAVSLQYDAATAVIERLEAADRQDAEEKARLTNALKGLLIEWDKLARYGSPIAKAANERVNAARAALACRGQGERA